MRSAPPAIKAKWNDLKGNPLSDRDKFKAEVLTVCRGAGWDKVLATFSSSTALVKKSGDKSVGGWVPWLQHIALHGEQQVRAMIQLNTVKFVQNPALAGSGLEFPTDQLFWEDKKTVESNTMLEERGAITNKADCDQETATQIQGLMLAAQPSTTSPPTVLPPLPQSQGSGSHGVQHGGLASGAGPHPGPSTPPLLQQLRKVHCAFDKQKREHNALLVQVVSNSLTANTPMHDLLVAENKAAEVQDQILLQEEVALAQGLATRENDTITASSLAECLDHMKKAQRFASALKQLLKLPNNGTPQQQQQQHP